MEMEENIIKNFQSQFPGGKLLVLECLRKFTNAQSVNPEVTKILMEMEKVAGFSFILLELYCETRNEDPNLCFLCISLCKNVVSRIWKPRNAYFLETEEKALIKNKIIHILDSFESIPNHKELISLIRRLCRYEFPNNWPNLFDCITRNLNQSSQNFELSNFTWTPRKLLFIMMLSHIIKEQSSKRLPKDKAATFNLGSLMIDYLDPLWKNSFENIVWSDSKDLDFQWEISLYIDRVMTYITTYFFEKVYQHHSAIAIVKKLSEKLIMMINMTKNASIDCTTKFFKNLSDNLKNFTLLLEFQPYSLIFMDISLFLQSILRFTIDIPFQVPEEFCIRITHLFRISFISNNFWARSIKTENSSPTNSSILEMSQAGCEQFHSFLENSGGKSFIVDIIYSKMVKIDLYQRTEWLTSEDGIDIEIFSSKLQKANKQFLTEVQQLQNSSHDFITPYVMSNLEKSIHDYIQKTNHCVPTRDLIETASRCQAMIDWSIVSLKASIHYDTLFSQILHLLREFEILRVLPGLQLRIVILIKKALNYGTVPSFEVPKLFQMLYNLLCSPSIQVKQYTIDTIIILYQKFHDDKVWMENEVLQDILSRICILLFELSEPDSCNKCLELIRILLSCTYGELIIITAFAHHQDQFKQLWNLHHENIREEIVNIIHLLLLRLENTINTEQDYFLWTLSISNGILLDFLDNESINHHVESDRTDGDNQQFVKRVFTLWTSILRIVPIKLFSQPQIKPLLEKLPLLLNFCTSSLKNHPSEITQRALEVVLEYLSLFFNAGIIPPKLLQNTAMGSSNTYLDQSFFNHPQISEISKIGMNIANSYLIVRRSLHMVIFVFLYSNSFEPYRGEHFEIFSSILVNYIQLSSLRRSGKKHSAKDNIELMKYVPEHFLPPICCWIMRNQENYKNVVRNLGIKEDADSQMEIFYYFSDSFKKLSDILLKSSVVICEILIIADFFLPFQFIKIIIETILHQLKWIIDHDKSHISQLNDTSDNEHFLNTFRGGIHQSSKMPEPRNFYKAFNCAMLHPSINSSQELYNCLQENIRFSSKLFVEYLQKISSSLSEMENKDLEYIYNSCPASVKNVLQNQNM